MSEKFDIPSENVFIASEEDLKIIQNSETISSQSGENTSSISVGEFSKVETKIPKINLQPIIKVGPVIAASETDLKTDYNYIRNNIYTITEKSVEALNNLVQIAEQSQHPRAYEVVAILVGTIASAQRDLMTIHQQKAKIEIDSNKNSPEVITNNLFVGNTAQLDEIISKMSQKKISSEIE